MSPVCYSPFCWWRLLGHCCRVGLTFRIYFNWAHGSRREESRQIQIPACRCCKTTWRTERAGHTQEVGAAESRCSHERTLTMQSGHSGLLLPPSLTHLSAPATLTAKLSSNCGWLNSHRLQGQSLIFRCLGEYCFIFKIAKKILRPHQTSYLAFSQKTCGRGSIQRRPYGRVNRISNDWRQNSNSCGNSQEPSQVVSATTAPPPTLPV